MKKVLLTYFMEKEIEGKVLIARNYHNQANMVPDYMLILQSCLMLINNSNLTYSGEVFLG